MGYRIVTSNRNSEKITIDFSDDLSVMHVSGLSKFYRVFSADDAYDFSGGPLLRDQFKVSDMFGQFTDIRIEYGIWRILDILTAENIIITEDMQGNLVARFDLSIGYDFLEFKKIK